MALDLHAMITLQDVFRQHGQNGRDYKKKLIPFIPYYFCLIVGDLHHRKI